MMWQPSEDKIKWKLRILWYDWKTLREFANHATISWRPYIPANSWYSCSASCCGKDIPQNLRKSLFHPYMTLNVYAHFMVICSIPRRQLVNVIWSNTLGENVQLLSDIFDIVLVSDDWWKVLRHDYFFGGVVELPTMSVFESPI